jgi:hypothetical protein
MRRWFECQLSSHQASTVEQWLQSYVALRSLDDHGY